MAFKLFVSTKKFQISQIQQPDWNNEEESWWKGKCLHFTILPIVTTDMFRCQVSDSVPGTWNLYHSQVPASHPIILEIQRCNGIYFGQVYCIANILLVKLFSCLCAVKLGKKKPTTKTTSSTTISEFVWNEKNLETELLQGSDRQVNIIHCTSLGGC